MKWLEDLADRFWGPRYSRCQALCRTTTEVDLGLYKGDVHEVALTLHKHVKERERGPQWARKPLLERYIASWECTKGIPVRNDHWEGDCIYESWMPISDPDNWFEEAEKELRREIARQRVRNGYIHDRRKR